MMKAFEHFKAFDSGTRPSFNYIAKRTHIHTQANTYLRDVNGGAVRVKLQAVAKGGNGGLLKVLLCARVVH